MERRTVMKLYNTLTRSLDEIQPLSGNSIKLYTCGLTVYSQPHIGNWTGYIYWDILVRTLTASGYEVQRTQNITDVGHLVSDDDQGNDKMEVGAEREGVTAWDIADKYISIADHEAYETLGLLRPQHIVRATNCIEEQIAFTKDLEARGFTYTIPEEGIYFDTSKLADYGHLARLDINGLQAGARVAVASKRNPTDFAVWKFSPAGKKRDMEWDSPWGKGFPGWHLECSVIARITLGDQIDIHTGGIDHIPVHHTNEIAQTEAVTGKRFANAWVHNNHLKVDGGKMSKSLGNIYTLSDLVNKGYAIDAFKLFVLSKHYRTEGNFTWENLDAAAQRLKHWQQLAVLRHQTRDGAGTTEAIAAFKTNLIDALADDIGTPTALTIIESMLDTIEASLSASSGEIGQIFETIDQLLGLNIIRDSPDIANEYKAVIQSREAARSRKDWAESDRLRDQLQIAGIGLSDAATGTIWYRL